MNGFLSLNSRQVIFRSRYWAISQILWHKIGPFVLTTMISAWNLMGTKMYQSEINNDAAIYQSNAIKAFVGWLAALFFAHLTDSKKYHRPLENNVTIPSELHPIEYLYNWCKLETVQKRRRQKYFSRSHSKLSFSFITHIPYTFNRMILMAFV